MCTFYEPLLHNMDVWQAAERQNGREGESNKEKRDSLHNCYQTWFSNMEDVIKGN